MSTEDPRTATGERETLTGLLADNRAEMLALLDGMSEEQVRRRLVPSLTTLLGLVKHATFVEQVWFQVVLEGRSRASIGVPEEIDDSFRLGETDTIESVVAAYARACAESDRIAATHRLDERRDHRRLGPVNLRWIYGHLIEELARHAGHGDILREQILAADSESD